MLVYLVCLIFLLFFGLDVEGWNRIIFILRIEILMNGFFHNVIGGNYMNRGWIPINLGNYPKDKAIVQITFREEGGFGKIKLDVCYLFIV